MGGEAGEGHRREQRRKGSRPGPRGCPGGGGAWTGRGATGATGCVRDPAWFDFCFCGGRTRRAGRGQPQRAVTRRVGGRDVLGGRRPCGGALGRRGREAREGPGRGGEGEGGASREGARPSPRAGSR